MRALAVAIGLCAARAAHADVARPLTLPAGTIEARLDLELDLPRGAFGDVALAPSVAYGLDDEWTVGITHGNASLDRIAAGAGVCLGDDCAERYSDVAADVRWRGRATGALQVAPRGRFVMRDFDPAKPALTVGALVRWQCGRFTITSDPYLRVGLANRDRGNRDVLMLPLFFGVQAGARWLVELHTGYDSELVNAGDGYHVPFALAVTVRAAPDFEVRVEGGFASLLGPQSDYKAIAAIVTLQRRWQVRPARRPAP